MGYKRMALALGAGYVLGAKAGEKRYEQIKGSWEKVRTSVERSPLARRLSEMVSLGERLVSIELVIAAQAVDLRGRPALGAGTRGAHTLVRERVPFTDAGEPLPQDLEPVLELIRAGALATG